MAITVTVVALLQARPAGVLRVAGPASVFAFRSVRLVAFNRVFGIISTVTISASGREPVPALAHFDVACR